MRGTWVVQSVGRVTSAQVMISRSVGSSPRVGTTQDGGFSVPRPHLLQRSQQSCETATIVTAPIFQMAKLRHRELPLLARGPAGSERQSRNSHPRRLGPRVPVPAHATTSAFTKAIPRAWFKGTRPTGVRTQARPGRHLRHTNRCGRRRRWVPQT